MRLQLGPEGLDEGQHCNSWQEMGEGVRGPSKGAGGEGGGGGRL